MLTLKKQSSTSAKQNGSTPTPHFIAVKALKADPYLAAALVVLFFLILFLRGHIHRSNHFPPAPQPFTRPSSALEAIRQVQKQPLYLQAQHSFQNHRYVQAAALLERLSKRPLLPAQKAFLQTQKKLCLLAWQHPKMALSVPKAASLQQASALADCGPRALLLVCQYLHIPTTLNQLRALTGTTSKGTTMLGLAAAAQKLGLRGMGVQVGPKAMAHLPMPALAWVNQNHYIAVLALNTNPPFALTTPTRGSPGAFRCNGCLALAPGTPATKPKTSFAARA